MYIMYMNAFEQTLSGLILLQLDFLNIGSFAQNSLTRFKFYSMQLTL